MRDTTRSKLAQNALTSRGTGGRTWQAPAMRTCRGWSEP